jgi:hypothetical protein
MQISTPSILIVNFSPLAKDSVIALQVYYDLFESISSFRRLFFDNQNDFHREKWAVRRRELKSQI